MLSQWFLLVGWSISESAMGAASSTQGKDGKGVGLQHFLSEHMKTMGNFADQSVDDGRISK